jgi:hypothetical protein
VFTGDPKVPTAAPGDNDTPIATTAFVQNAITSAGTAFTTGDLKPTHKTAADTGWILWVDGTIGSAGSGSSVRANADTQALFTLYYGGYVDAICPLLTSAGAATTRAAQGAAATAFGAGCRMTLPRGPGRSVGVAGSGSGLTARSLGVSIGAETHVQTFNELAQHFHFITDPGHSHGVNDSGHVHDLIPQPAQIANQFTAGGTSSGANPGPSSTQGATTGITIQSQGTGITVNNSGFSSAMNIMNPSTYVNIMIKL